MNPALRLGFGLLMIGLVGLVSGCSTATQKLPRTARLEFSMDGVPYKAALHEYYVWRLAAFALLEPHALTLVDQDDASYIVTIDVRSLPESSTPALYVTHIGLNPERPKRSSAMYADKDKEYTPRFNRPTHESFKLAEALERAAQLSPTTSP